MTWMHVAVPQVGELPEGASSSISGGGSSSDPVLVDSGVIGATDMPHGGGGFPGSISDIPIIGPLIDALTGGGSSDEAPDELPFGGGMGGGDVMIGGEPAAGQSSSGSDCVNCARRRLQQAAEGTASGAQLGSIAGGGALLPGTWLLVPRDSQNKVRTARGGGVGPSRCGGHQDLPCKQVT